MYKMKCWKYYLVHEIVKEEMTFQCMSGQNPLHVTFAKGTKCFKCFSIENCFLVYVKVPAEMLIMEHRCGKKL